MGLIHEAAVLVGTKTRDLVCTVNNIVRPNDKIRVMKRTDLHNGHVDWFFVPKDSQEIIDLVIEGRPIEKEDL